MQLKYITILILLFTLPARADLMIKDAFAITSTPKSKSGAIFMTIHNHKDADRLLSAKTDVSKISQLHSSKMEGDVVKMIHQKEGFAIPSHGDLVLQHGGKHIMLMGLKESFKIGDFFLITLYFENAGEIDVKVLYKGNSKHTNENDHSHDH